MNMNYMSFMSTRLVLNSLWFKDNNNVISICEASIVIGNSR